MLFFNVKYCKSGLKLLSGQGKVHGEVLDKRMIKLSSKSICDCLRCLGKGGKERELHTSLVLLADCGRTVNEFDESIKKRKLKDSTGYDGI